MMVGLSGRGGVGREFLKLVEKNASVLLPGSMPFPDGGDLVLFLAGSSCIFGLGRGLGKKPPLDNSHSQGCRPTGGCLVDNLETETGDAIAITPPSVPLSESSDGKDG